MLLQLQMTYVQATHLDKAQETYLMCCRNCR